ncbi:MAG: PD-(D/E)XK nuclease family protein, partial [Oscillospiraceae bacterium]|nr:PD-(D/E)XK nuclease family protein [Oscillospiraceae bacterium]
PPPDAEALRELEENLAFRYPHAEAVELPSKLTATGLKGRAEADADAAPLFPRREGDFRMPDFGRKDRPLSGAQRGTATHLLLQYMDFAAGESRERVEREIERLRLLKILSDREAGAVDAAAVVRLFTSPLGRRMLRAERLEREFRFSLLCDAGELLGRAPGEQVLLQGVVDCCIEENGALTVIDYKTDAVRGGDAVAERSRLYAGQLRAYALALRRIFGLPVKECVLYFLAAGQAVSLPGCP